MTTPARTTRRLRNVTALLLAPLILYVLLRLFEYAQVFQPHSQLIVPPNTIHKSPEDIFFPTIDGCRLNGWFFAAPAQSPWNDWAVLLSHGNGGNISHRLDLCALWLAEGFNVLAYDYRGYGSSNGRPSEKGTYRDAESAHQWLRKRGFPAEKIIALGESLGGAVAAELALRKPIGGLVLQSTFTSIPDIGKEHFPWLPVRTLGAIRYATRTKLPSLKIPILILHSRADTIIPFHHSQQNYQTANKPKLFQEITGDHNDNIANTAQLYRQGIRAFKKLLAPQTAAAPPTAE